MHRIKCVCVVEMEATIDVRDRVNCCDSDDDEDAMEPPLDPAPLLRCGCESKSMALVVVTAGVESKENLLAAAGIVKAGCLPPANGGSPLGPR